MKKNTSVKKLAWDKDQAAQKKHRSAARAQNKFLKRVFARISRERRKREPVDRAYRKAVAERRAWAEKFLRDPMRAFERGNLPALWDIIVYCEENDTPKPERVRRALIQYARDIAPTLARPGRTGGSRSLFKTMQEDMLRDMYCLVSVEGLIEDLHCTPSKAAQLTAEELHTEKRNVERACERARTRRRTNYLSYLLPQSFPH